MPYNAKKRERIKKMLTKGMTFEAIGRFFKCSKQAIHAMINYKRKH